MNLRQIAGRFVQGQQASAALLNAMIDLLNELSRRVSERASSSGTAATRSCLSFEIDSAISGATGYYKVKTFTGDFVGTGTSPLTAADFGDKASVADAVGVNTVQIGRTGTDGNLAAGTIHWGTIVGRMPDSGDHAGKLIIEFTGYKFYICPETP